jgi:adenine-specific DNA-methyltransferase
MEVRHLAVSLFILGTVEIRDEMPKTLDDYTKEELIDIIKGLKRRKKFGLVWEEKPEKVVGLCDTELPVIEEVTKKAISKSKDKANNIIIEGDNYHSLSVLNYTHAGKIDVIYIDPPYNTGSNDFIYNDRYVDKEDGYRHSKWLSFMGNRLRLAKSLLSKQGVIFISIDDNEVAQLSSSHIMQHCVFSPQR